MRIVLVFVIVILVSGCSVAVNVGRTANNNMDYLVRPAANANESGVPELVLRETFAATFEVCSSDSNFGGCGTAFPLMMPLPDIVGVDQPTVRLIVSAAHIFCEEPWSPQNCAQRARIRYTGDPDGRWEQAKIYFGNFDHDIIILEATTRVRPLWFQKYVDGGSTPFLATWPSNGTEVIGIAWDGVDIPFTTSGTAPYYCGNEDCKWVHGDAVPGQSGSPVFSDTGQVVGVLVATDKNYGQSVVITAEGVRKTYNAMWEWADEVGAITRPTDAR